jgi:hypothetical protein
LDLGSIPFEVGRSPRPTSVLAFKNPLDLGGRLSLVTSLGSFQCRCHRVSQRQG